MSAIARRVLGLVGLVILVFGLGYLSALYFAPTLMADADHEIHGVPDDVPDEEAVEDDHEAEEHVALTAQAFDNLGLKLGKLSRRDYWKSQIVPGEVVEIPGRSKVTVSAPVTGVVDSVFVRPGETMASTDRLFTLRITDENLTAAQSKLLDGIARGEIIKKEITRLAPLTSAGAIVGRRKRDLEYELAQLESAQAVLRQQMESRGLPNSRVVDIVRRRLLASTLEITAPNSTKPAVLAKQEVIQPVSLETTSDHMDYVIEEIHVHPGQTVQRGDPLCTLNDHAELYIRGQAFESDLPLLDQLVKKDWGISAEFSHDQPGSNGEPVIRQDLRLLRIDNAVGTESQTLMFFLPLRNEISQTLRDEEGRSFAHWRFKPGQRVHLRIPTQKWEDPIVIPLEAVVIDGPNATVFTEHTEEAEERDHEDGEHDHHLHEHHDDDDHGHAHGHHDEVFIEFEPVPVRLLHRDDRHAVIADDGQLADDHRIAMNAAYELQQALKMQASGGGGIITTISCSGGVPSVNSMTLKKVVPRFRPYSNPLSTTLIH